MDHHWRWLRSKWWGKLIMAAMFFSLSYLLYTIFDIDMPPSNGGGAAVEDS